MIDDLTRCPCCEGDGYFYGDEKPPSPWGDAAELSRLRAEVDRLTAERDTAKKYMAAYAECDRIGTEAYRDLADQHDALRAEVDRLTKALATVQRAARTLHAAGQEITRNAVAAALGDAVALREIDRTEYTAAASLDSERQANAMLTDALERAEAALSDERAHADALMDDVRQRLSYDAETFHDQGAWDREDACLAIMKMIDLHRARRQG